VVNDRRFAIVPKILNRCVVKMAILMAISVLQSVLVSRTRQRVSVLLALESTSVCGSDDITYSSQCEAERVGMTDTTSGECTPAKSCVCMSVHEPVCGSNGKTYSNKCLANCVGMS